MSPKQKAQIVGAWVNKHRVKLYLNHEDYEKHKAADALRKCALLSDVDKSLGWALWLGPCGLDLVAWTLWIGK